ncbi:imidazolonepropionase [Marinicella sp. W31]|uniref:imidazolonepropionase n=1 Tax=Marinicella sp. W31 TaxID=3023713 RepID=UPI003758230F
MQEFDQLIRHAAVATMVDNGQPYGLLQDGAVGYRDGVIQWIGRSDALTPAQLDNAQVLDADGYLLTPALIDCHTHLIFGGNRAHEFEQRLQGHSYAEIAAAGGGIMYTVEATRASNTETLFSEARERIMHLFSQGVMTIEVKSGYGLDLENEIKMLQVAQQLGKKTPVKIVPTFLGAHATPSEFKDQRQQYIDLICKEMIPLIAKEKLAVAVDAFCESIGFTHDEVEQVFAAASRWGLPVKLHAEQLSNLKGSALVCEYGGLSADHVEYTDEASIRKMAEFDVVATLLPYAFYSLNETQKPPVELFRKHQVPMAVATDCNPGTAPTTNLLQCMHMACTLFGLTIEEAWLGVTRHAAQALQLEDSLGTLEIGKKAQMVIWKHRQPADVVYWQGQNPVEQLIYT